MAAKIEIVRARVFFFQARSSRIEDDVFIVRETMMANSSLNVPRMTRVGLKFDSCRKSDRFRLTELH